MSENLIVSVPVELDDEFIEDVVCTMLEGGSNYWVDTIDIDHPEGQRPRYTPVSTWAADALNKGGNITIYPIEEEDGIVTINRENLVSGVKQLIDEHPDRVAVTYDHKANHIDFGSMDADDADAILQYAVFGDLIFG